MSKSNNETITAIMSEQLKLVRTERELINMIDSVNGQLNQLLVEELQLKSSQVTGSNMDNSGHNPVYPVALSAAVASTTAELARKLDSAVDINRQQLDLCGEMIVDGGIRYAVQIGDEEEEEEDEEEDEL